jgi:hypothetical protein
MMAAKSVFGGGERNEWNNSADETRGLLSDLAGCSRLNFASGQQLLQGRLQAKRFQKSHGGYEVVVVLNK